MSGNHSLKSAVLMHCDEKDIFKPSPECHPSGFQSYHVIRVEIQGYYIFFYKKKYIAAVNT